MNDSAIDKAWTILLACWGAWLLFGIGGYAIGALTHAWTAGFISMGIGSCFVLCAVANTIRVGLIMWRASDAA